MFVGACLLMGVIMYSSWQEYGARWGIGGFVAFFPREIFLFAALGLLAIVAGGVTTLRFLRNLFRRSDKSS